MKYRRLGSTDLQVSVIGVGTWQFGGEWGLTYSDQEAAAVLDAAKEAGINLIDTAECYGDHTSERFIGQWLRSQKREDWVIATKFGHKFHDQFDRTNHWSAEEVLSQLEDSLRSLQTDYVDLYQFHSGPDEMFDNDELWTMLDKQVQAGKIRNLGISIGSNQNIHQTDAATKVNAKAIQVVYNRLERQPEAEVFPSCIHQDLGVLARVPLASGYLSGKYKPDSTFSENDVRSRHDREEARKKLEEVARIQREEVPENMDMATWALAWCLKHDAVTCVIPGCKNPEQVRKNAVAAQYVSDDHPQAAKLS
ncbi:aldo/keto reductase [Xylanibacillus composti]|uniref:Oxidoreductase n=1 Tax=Xylanibacillus composti TaxID=1572762 RepID=A0A8J4M3L0_9BACL|nr:aldo/keto reductase [Xylanibacillus composti]MDT9724669.1 aldo/keto reductase [Xylanibacillus composti]GIQ70954.1 oxidoreductase [Xylanibacillus composti]